MTNQDINQIETFFQKIENRVESFSPRLYKILFEINPSIETLFKSVGMEMQGRMVVQALGVGIRSYHKHDDFRDVFQSLGKRHALYGVKDELYPNIGEAFLKTCESVFGEEFTDELAEKFGSFLTEAVAEMINGASEHNGGKRVASTFTRRNESLDDPYLARFLKDKERARPEVIPNAVLDVSQKVKLTYLGDKTVDANPLKTILEASHENDIPHMCECGGTARCSTCRVMIVDGLENCLPRTSVEERMASRKGFYPEIRLACQTRVVGDVTLKRLVRDENDVDMAISGSIGDAGEEIYGAVLFTDIWGFTAFSEKNLPYDIIHALNLLFRKLGQAVDDNDGYVDKYNGDSLMAIFGLAGGSPEATCRSAVSAATSMFDSLPEINKYLKSYLGDEFRIGIGIAYGPMVTGELGFQLKRQFTAIGDTVNIAARLESETRKHDVELIVSDSVIKNLLPDTYELLNTYEFDLKGKTEKVTGHELVYRG